MSSKGRRGLITDTSQHIYNFFPTPSWAVRRLLEVYTPPSGRWLEPGAGAGAIIKAVNNPFVNWTAVELRRHAYFRLSQLVKNVHIADFFDYTSSYLTGMGMGILKPFDVAIGNPPYSVAKEFIDAALSISQEVIFLLRLNFLGSDSRAEWLRDNYPDVYVLPNRISGTQDGKTDSTEYAWFRWRACNVGRLRTAAAYEILAPTPLEERKLDLLR